eukprot:scaffold153149_cov32-Tisochrysis_lutea.AAC.1
MQAYAILSDPEKRRMYDATGEADFADFDMDDFLSSGVLDAFFHEMMEETGMAEEMMAELGGDVKMGDLKASFESFLKASMGMSTGPVLMPDGTVIDAADVPSLREMEEMDGLGALGGLGEASGMDGLVRLIGRPDADSDLEDLSDAEALDDVLQLFAEIDGLNGEDELSDMDLLQMMMTRRKARIPGTLSGIPHGDGDTGPHRKGRLAGDRGGMGRRGLNDIHRFRGIGAKRAGGSGSMRNRDGESSSRREETAILDCDEEKALVEMLTMLQGPSGGRKRGQGNTSASAPQGASVVRARGTNVETRADNGHPAGARAAASSGLRERGVGGSRSGRRCHGAKSGLRATAARKSSLGKHGAPKAGAVAAMFYDDESAEESASGERELSYGKGHNLDEVSEDTQGGMKPSTQKSQELGLPTPGVCADLTCAFHRLGGLIPLVWHVLKRYHYGEALAWVVRVLLPLSQLHSRPPLTEHLSLKSVNKLIDMHLHAPSGIAVMSVNAFRRQASTIDISLPIEQQWFAAAKQGQLVHMKKLFAEVDTGKHPSHTCAALLGAQARGIGHTALHWASSAGKLETMTWLIQMGADINAANSGGSRPLHSAVSSGQFEAAELLLSHGADKNATDEFGDSAIDVAKQRGMSAMLELLKAAPA